VPSSLEACTQGILAAWEYGGALGGFGHARRGDDLSGELIDGANVNELAGLASIKNGEDFFLVSAQGFVSARDVIGGWSDFVASVESWRFSSSHFLRPPLMRRTSLWP